MGEVHLAERELRRIGKAGRDAGRGADKAAAATDRQARAAKRAERANRGFAQSLRALRTAGLAGAGYALTTLVKGSLQAGVAMEGWQAKLRVATG